MKRLAVAPPVAAFVASLAACSILTSLDGLSGGANDTDAAGDASMPMPIDGGSDVATTWDAGDAGPTPSDLYAMAVLADQPLGYWRLEETSGTAAKDETGRYEGLYVQTPMFGEVGAAGSRAIKLAAGTKARIQVSSSMFRFPGTSPYSVELWAKPGALKDYQWLSGTEVASGPRSGWSLLADATGGVHYEVWRPNDGGTDQVRGVIMPSPIAAGTLHHIVVTYSGGNGGSVLGYIDGVAGTPFKTGGLCPDVGVLTWACRADLNHCLDDWVIDELAIYGSVLPEARVKAHYALGK